MKASIQFITARFRALLLLATILYSAITAAAQTQDLWVGETYTCDASSAILGSYTDMSWSVSGGYISTSGSGLYRDITITQYFSGTATITCKWKYYLYYGDNGTWTSKSWTVRCRDNQVSISPTKMTLAVGQTKQLGYSHQFTNQYTSAANAYFSSGSPYVTVTRDGKVTGVKPGTAYVNVYSKISSVSPYCEITVLQPDPESVEINPASATVYLDETKTLKATVYPEGASQSVTWSVESGKTDIISVSSSGVVTAKAVGKAYVYATTSNNCQGKCLISTEEPALTISETYPASDASGVSVFTVPSITFSHNISAASAFTRITLKSQSGSEIEGCATISGKTLKFTPAYPLNPRTKYELYMPKQAVKNKWGTEYGYAKTVTFTTGDLEKLNVEATTADRFFASGDQISLKCNKTGATIYYTVDGSTPTEASARYTTPITITKDFVLKALAVMEGYEDSDILTVEYHITNAEIVSRFPDKETMAVYRDVNPNVRYSNKIKASAKIEDIRLYGADGNDIPCEFVVADSSIYLIPKAEIVIGSSYSVDIPADAVRTKDGEPNKKYSWTFSTGDFATAISMGGYELGTAIKTDASLSTWGTRYASGDEATWNVQFNPQAAPATFIDKDVAASSSGYMHHAVIKTDGTLWMWGRQYCGEFGNGATTASPTPVKIMGNVRAVSAGGQHTAIIKTDNTLWMCGRNDFGQIGNGTYDVCKTPVKVMEGVSSCAAGWCVTLAVTESGELYAWGRNDLHQLGDGTDSLRLKPVKILDDVAIAEASPTESGYFAAIKTDGTLWIWGGETAVPECRASDVCTVAVGTDYVMYVTTDGNLHAWGGNEYGQLGTGNLDSTATPVLVMAGVADVATGGQTTMAIKDDGSVWTWGRNYAGNLGQEAAEPSKTAYAATPACVIEGLERGSLQGLYSRKNLAIVIGGVAVAEMYPLPLNAVYEAMEWSSSDQKVATVSDRGVVFAEGRGNADITCTATSADGTKATAVCHVFVGTKEEIDTGIDDVLADGGNLKVWSHDMTIHISGIDTGANVRVYDTRGIEILSAIADGDTMQIPVNISGVYIVNVDNAVHKVLCR